MAEQIAYVLKQAEIGTPVAEICRKIGVSEQTFSSSPRGFDFRYRCRRSRPRLDDASAGSGYHIIYKAPSTE